MKFLFSFHVKNLNIKNENQKLVNTKIEIKFQYIKKNF